MDGVLACLRAIAQTLWIGGMWTAGLIVAPTLYGALDRLSAGLVANRMFAALAWVGIVCGVILLLEYLWRYGLRGVRQLGFWLLVGMVLCTLLNHFAVTPILAGFKPGAVNAAEGVFGGGFATWQAISSLILLLQSLMGLAYVVRSDN